MFSQLFGKYLVENGILRYADYRQAVTKQLDVRAKLGTIAVAEGFLTEEEAEAIHQSQKQHDKRFGDMAVEKGFLTQAQIDALVEKQGNPYMQFLEVLLDFGQMSIGDIEDKLAEFQEENGYSHGQMIALKEDDFEAILPMYMDASKPFLTELVSLMLRNIDRFVTRDFYIEKLERVQEMNYICLAGQKIYGQHTIQIALAADQSSEGFLKLASSLTGEPFATVEEDALDAVCEFINCIGGLFVTDQSKKDVYLDLQPVYAYENQKLTGEAYVLPIYIEDCKLNLILSVDGQVEMGQKTHQFSYEKEDSNFAVGLSKGKIAIVDDSKISRKVLRTILEDAGYAVIAEGTDGEEGIAVYMQYKPDVLTMDITMPNMDGTEALREIMSVDRNAKVLMISDAGQQQKIDEALALGAVKFITKPFEPEEVIASIESILEK